MEGKVLAGPLTFSIMCAGDEIPDHRVSRFTRSSN
jgi:hypothetical protein